MPAVAPIGDEVTDSGEFFSGLCRCAQIGQRVVVPANQGLPRRSAGADVKGNLRLRKLRPLLRKRMICLVAPIQGNNVCSSGRESALTDRSV